MKLYRLAGPLLPLFLTAASPPFPLDIANPPDTALVSSYPANERAFRDNANSYINTEHDINTGYHKFQLLTNGGRNALLNPPTGMVIYKTNIGAIGINNGSSSSPASGAFGVPDRAIKCIR